MSTRVDTSYVEYNKGVMKYPAVSLSHFNFSLQTLFKKNGCDTIYIISHLKCYVSLVSDDSQREC